MLYTSPWLRAWRRLGLPAVLLTVLVVMAPPTARSQSPAPRPAVPEGLNFANGLFRDRRYALAADEYEHFLKTVPPGPAADEARFGLANARLFQGQYEKARRHFEEFLKVAPRHPNVPIAWYRIGETAYVLGDPAAARQALETYLADPKPPRYVETAWPYLGDVCFRLGDLPKAREAYEKSLADQPEGRLASRSKLGLGRTLALQGATDEAVKTLTDLAEHGGPDWADKAWFQTGQAQAAAGHPDKAVEAFETLERLAPKSPLLTEGRLRRGEALLKLDRLADAGPLLKAIAADDAAPGLAGQAAFALGTALLERGQADEAFATLDEALKRSPNAPLAPALLFRSAEARLKQGQADDARARFLKAAALDPKDPWADDALLHAARIALEARDLDAARELAKSFATKFPESTLRAAAHLIEARAALSADQPKGAVTLLTALLEGDKPDPDTAQSARYYLGLAYKADGQSEKAKELLDALADTPAAPVAADAQFLVGQGHLEAKRYGEAVPALRKYLDAKPKGEVADYALAHLAHAQLELNQPEAAGKALDELAERFPQSKTLAPTRLRLAEAALTAKDYERAIGLFTVVAASPEPALKARAQSGLGWALLDSGKPAEAAAAFAALLEATPDDPLAADAALARGHALQQDKQVEPALAAYAVVTENYPQSEQAVPAALARARLLVEAGKPADAAPAFEQLVKDHPDPKQTVAGATRDDLLAEWGWALLEAGQTAEADRAYNRLLTEFPESPRAADARLNLAESAAKAKDYDATLKLLGPVVAAGSKAPPQVVEPALYRVARTRAERQEWPAAAEALDRFLKDFPESRYRRMAKLLRAEVALRTDDAAAAEEALSVLAAAPAEPTDPEGFAPAVRRQRLQGLLALKRWKDALELGDALKHDAPDDPLTAEIDYARGRALQGLARFDEARDAFQAVIDARKGGELAAKAQLMRGETFFHQKNYREALREFLKVDILYDAPAWQAAALLEAGKVHEQLEQWPDASETYERLLAKFPDDPTAEAAKTRLDAAKKRQAGPPNPASEDR